MTPPPSSEEPDAPEGGRWWMPLWLRLLMSIGVLLIVLLAGITTGIIVERQRYDGKVLLDESWSELGHVIEAVESDSYYRPDAGESRDDWTSKLEQGAIAGLLHASGDDYARLLPPDEADESSTRLTGEYEGVGISISDDDGDVEVVSIMVDSPADRADIRVGDVVKQVASTPIAGGNVDLAADLLRGDAGSDVSIQLRRPEADTFTVRLERERISTGAKTVGYRHFPNQDVAVIQIALFAATTPGELDQALEHAREDDVERLVLDLRGNPGGWVSAAQRVIGRFVDPPTGPALLEDSWPAGTGMTALPIRSGTSDSYRGELVVLVDAGTASAAEIVTGALQYYDRAVVVGAETYGKGSVQRVYDFPSGDSLRLTIAEWFTPGGDPLQDVGVTPDVVIDPEGPVEELFPRVLPAFGRDPATVAPAATPSPAGATP